MKNNARAFANQLLVYLLVTICFGGTAAVGLVWMRHQISVTANHNRALMARLREIERQVTEATTIAESAQSPDSLRRLNVEFGLGLAPKSDGQMVHVTEDPVQLVMARVNRELFTEGTAPISLPAMRSR